MSSLVILLCIILFTVFLISFYLWYNTQGNNLLISAFALSVIAVAALFLFSVPKESTRGGTSTFVFILLITILSLLFVYMQSATVGSTAYYVAALGGSLATVAAVLSLITMSASYTRMSSQENTSSPRGKTNKSLINVPMNLNLFNH